MSLTNLSTFSETVIAKLSLNSTQSQLKLLSLALLNSSLFFKHCHQIENQGAMPALRLFIWGALLQYSKLSFPNNCNFLISALYESLFLGLQLPLHLHGVVGVVSIWSQIQAKDFVTYSPWYGFEPCELHGEQKADMFDRSNGKCQILENSVKTRYIVWYWISEFLKA